MSAVITQAADRLRLSMAPLLAMALLLSFTLAAILIVLSGDDASAALSALVSGSVGSTYALGNTVSAATPLLFTALAAVIVFRARLYAIGAEGQMYLGGLAGTLVAIHVDLPGPLLIVVALVVSALVGALWAVAPALGKAYRGTNEVMSTLLLNYIAIYIVAYLVSPSSGPFHGEGFMFGATDYVNPDSHLPSLIPGAQANAGLLLGIFLAIGLSFLLARTTFGFQVRTLGESADSARYAGHAVKRTVVVAMVVSGAMAGVAVTVTVLAQFFLMSDSISPAPGWGYTGIAVALLAGLRPVPVIFAALFFGALDAGSQAMQISTDVPASLGDIIQSTIILFVLAVPILHQRQVRRRQRLTALQGYDERLAHPASHSTGSAARSPRDAIEGTDRA